ncbi:MAG: hypothetical protein ABIU05_21690, partial [Nitrospirales bacterium]
NALASIVRTFAAISHFHNADSFFTLLLEAAVDSTCRLIFYSLIALMVKTLRGAIHFQRLFGELAFPASFLAPSRSLNKSFRAGIFCSEA